MFLFELGYLVKFPYLKVSQIHELKKYSWSFSKILFELLKITLDFIHSL